MPEVLGKEFYELHLPQFLAQRVLLLASQEAIFIKPQFSSHEKLKPTSSNRSFSLVISGWGERELGVVCCMFTMAVKIYLV